METHKNIHEELYVACKEKRLTDVKSALKRGADPCNKIERTNACALLWSVNYIDDSTEILQAIISSGKAKNINVRGFINNSTPLLWACGRGNVKCAKILMENGADPKVKDIYGKGVLYDSVFSGKVAMVEECLKWNGVNVNQRWNKNKTALILACEKCNVDMVRVLVDAGADVDLGDGDGSNAFFYAKWNQEIVELLESNKSSEVSKQRTTPPVVKQSSFTLPDLPPVLRQLSISSLSKNEFNQASTEKDSNPDSTQSDSVRTTPVASQHTDPGQTAHNITLLNNIIKNQFPEFDEGKRISILLAVQKLGIDCSNPDIQDILFLRDADFENVLTPIKARRLVSALKNEYVTKKVVVGNF